MTAHPDPDRVPGEGLYRLLLRLHPRAFRDRYGRDMVELFRDAWRDRARGCGLAAHLRFWIGVVAGTAWSAARQRWGRFRGRRPGGAAPDGRGDEGGAPPGRPTSPRSPRGRRNGAGDGIGAWTGDLAYALRALVRRPGFTVVVVVTLALGIGANTAVFSVLHAVLLSPLPYEDADRLVRIYESRTDDPGARNYLPAAAFLELRESLTTVGAVSVLYNYQQETADLTAGDRPERVTVLPVSQGYFATVGVEPTMGRAFRRDEEADGARVAVVSQRIFRTYLDGRADALGSTLDLDGVPHRVVGVVPEGYEDPLQGRIDAFTPVELDLAGEDAWGNHYLTGLLRLRPGATVEQLRAELASAARRHRRAAGEEALAYAAVPLRDDLVGSADTTLWLLMGAVGLVFLIACVNVASVTLARGAARRKELAIRSALGSGRRRLVRQLLTESALLAVVGGAAGLAVGAGVADALVALAPADLPGLERAGLDAPVFLFAAGASAAAVLLFGLVPALKAAGPGVGSALRQGDRGGREGPGAIRMRKALVVAEVALALMLLVGAGVLARSLQRLAAVDLAVDPENVAVFQVSTPEGRYDAGARARLHLDFLERLAGLPGVRTAGAVSWLPVGGNYHNWGTRRVADRERRSEVVGTNQRVVEGDYFGAVGIELLRGRTFDATDGPDDPNRIVVNRAAASALFEEGADPVGRALRIGPWRKEIIGVVENVPTSPRGRVRPIVYHRHAQFADNRSWTLRYTVKLRSGALDGFLSRARQELAGLDPDLVLYEPGLLSEHLARQRATERFATTLLVAFSAVALLLAAVGIYGVLAHAVSRRRHELGVRVALGARVGDVRRMVVGQGLALAAGGVLLGLAGAALGARWLSSLAFQVSVRDPAVYGVVAAGVLSVAAAASWIPAVRATRVDPVEAFRSE